MVVGLVAMILAAKEYGINSPDDLRNLLSQVLRYVNTEELIRV